MTFLGTHISALWPSVLVAIALATGCQRQVDVHAYDRAPLKALEKYAPVYKLDNNGRIVDLKLEKKQLNDDAFDQIAKFTALQTLSLYGSSLTDANLAKLQSVGQLTALGLGATAVTDDGLQGLAELHNLRWLWLNGDDGVTQRGLKSLKQSLPDLVVYR